MRQLPRPATLVLALGLATVLAGAACAPGQSADNNDEPHTQVSLDPASFKGKTLNYLYFTDGPDEQATRAQIAKFEKETGAKVNLQIVPFDNLEQTLQSRVNSGDAPEVARTNDWRPYADVLVDFHRYFGKDYDKKFVAGSAKASVDEDGAMRAVPSDLTMNGPLVNVDAFKKANVPLPTADHPWTFDEMVAAGQKVKRANHMANAFAVDKSGHRLSTVLSEFGTTFFTEDGKVAFDEKKAEKALTEINKLMQSGDMDKNFWLESGSRYKGANEIFLAKQTPIYLSGNWQVGLLQQDATFDWAAVPNPCEERCGGFPGGKYMIAFSKSDQPDLGAYFVDWMNRPENQAEIDKTAYWLPTRNELVDKGVDYPKGSDDMNVFLGDIKKTPADGYANNGDKNFTPAAELLVQELDKVVAGQQDVATAVKNVRTGLEKLAG